MNLIKNAFVYAADLPAAAELVEHLQKKPYQKLGATQRMRFSFVENSVTHELVTPIEGGYTFSFRCDEKILPPAVVETELEERIEKIEREEERRVSRKERTEIKDEVVLEMLPNAFVKHTIIHAFFNTDSQLFIVSTSGGSQADNLLSELRDVVGSFKVRKLTIADLDVRLTNKLMAYIKSEGTEGFGAFDLGRYLQLKDADKNKSTFDTQNTPYEGIEEAIRTSCQVERIELFAPNISFRLTRTFDFKSVNFGDVDPDDDTDWDEDVAGLWRHEAAVQVALLIGAVDDLGKLFDTSMALEADEGEASDESDSSVEDEASVE